MRDILLLDLDNTILDFDKSEECALKEVFIKYNIEDTKENRDLYYKINVEYWKKYEKHLISRDLLIGYRFNDFFKLFNKEVNGFEVNDYYFKHLSSYSFYMDKAEEFLKECEKRKITVLIASNGLGLVQNPRIEKSGLKKYFQKVYLSEEIGYNKPDIEFYESILVDYPFKERMVMIGDSLSSDIQGGVNFGIPTIWYNYKHLESSLPDYQVDNLMDIFKILEEI